MAKVRRWIPRVEAVLSPYLLASETRAATQAMQREWRADRDLMFATLTHHRVRFEALESNARRSPADPSAS